MALTPIQAVRTCIGDKNAVQFSDDEIQFFLDSQGESIFLASGAALDAWAASIGTILKEQRIGDFFDQSGRNQVSALQAQAEAFRQIEYNTPAFDFAEENYNEFTQYDIIRNYILRTAP